MIKKALKAVNIPAKESRYPNPPEGTYAVYFDDIETDGPDGINSILFHNYTVELYEAKKDAEAEAAFEAWLNAQGIRYTKQSRYWLKDIQRFQVIYEFTIIERRRT